MTGEFYSRHVRCSLPPKWHVEANTTVMLTVAIQNLFSYRLPQGIHCFLTACRKETKTSFPLPPDGPYRFEKTISANRLAASRSYKDSCMTPHGVYILHTTYMMCAAENKPMILLLYTVLLIHSTKPILAINVSTKSSPTAIFVLKTFVLK